jgi:hypothetical protein
MADKYLDTTLYTYAATPTWGTAQEGDGTATGAATPATMSLDMTGWTFTSGSSTFSVMGCTALTVGAGANSATNAQYSATLTTMIDNMVAAINLATASVVNVPAGWTASQVRNTVFARRTGNSLELMTRAGSAGWNTLTAMTFANVTGSSSGTWSGGAGGAWGWLFNVAAIWPSAIAVGAYGLWAATQPLAGVQSAFDDVYIRANNQTITLPATTTTNITIPTTIGASGVVTYYIDSGNKWGGDSSSAVLTISYSTTNSSAVTITLIANIRVISKKLSSTTYTLFIDCAASSSASGHARVAIAGSIIDGLQARIVVTGSANPASSIVQFLSYGTGPNETTLKNAWLSQNTVQPAWVSSGGSGGVLVGKCENVVFDNAGNVSQHPGVLSIVSSTTDWEFIGCEFANFITGSRLLTSGSSQSTRLAFVDTLGFSGITKLLRPMAGTEIYNKLHWNAGFSRFGTQDCWIDTYRGAVVWNGGASQPTLNATLPDGSTKWSLLVAMPTNSAHLGRFSYMETPTFYKKNTLSAAARTFKVQVAITDQETWTKSDIALFIRYMDAGGDMVSIDTFVPLAALSSSSVTWSAESGGKVVYSDGGTLYHNKFELSVSTPAGFNLPADAIVDARVRLYKSVGNATRYVFVDPDIEII